MWARLVPFGVVLLVAYVVDSTISLWSTAYLHHTLAASLAAALAHAAYQAGTVTGRAGADLMVRPVGPVAVIRAAAPLTAVVPAGLAVAPSRPHAVVAACCAGLGVAALTSLCVAAAGRLQPSAPARRSRRERGSGAYWPLPHRLRDTRCRRRGPGGHGALLPPNGTRTAACVDIPPPRLGSRPPRGRGRGRRP